MKTCYRCGVEFDSTPFLPSTPCEDCQDWVDEPEAGWITPRELKTRQEAEFARRTEAIVRDLYDQGYNDGQIASRIGYSKKWTQAYRNLIGLPIQSQFVADDVDPIVQDQRMKHRRAMEDYDWSKRRFKGELSRVENAKFRLMYGWPDETEYWQIQGMKDAGLE